ncbi:TPA: hypothetical protein HA244_00210 [Candidatus Micrarchaeota archaeon]|nr:hypothetical protein [Candidatus Micrarchaeota archaeon]
MKEDKNLLYVGVALSVVALAVAGFAFMQGQQTQTEAYAAKSYGISANSCDADSICEVAKTVSTRAGSSSNLILTSDTRKVNIQYDLIIPGSLNTGDITIAGKTITTRLGSTGSLLLTADNGKVNVQNELFSPTFWTDTLYLHGKTISTKAGSGSALFLTSDNKQVEVQGALSVNSLAGTGIAYACLDSTGKIYRSMNPCR